MTFAPPGFRFLPGFGYQGCNGGHVTGLGWCNWYGVNPACGPAIRVDRAPWMVAGFYCLTGHQYRTARLGSVL